jgi:hypothetical protein
MTRRGAYAPRCLAARTFGFERLEDRSLPSTFPAPFGPQLLGVAAESAFVATAASRATNVSPAENDTGSVLGDITVSSVVTTLGLTGDSTSAVGRYSGAVDGNSGLFAAPANSPTMAITVILLPSGAIISDGEYRVNATNLSSEMIFAMLDDLTDSGQTTMRLGAAGDNEILLVNGLATPNGEISARSVGSMRLAPLLTEHSNTYAKVAANGANNVSTETSFSNMATVAGSSLLVLATSAANNFSAGTGDLLAIDPILSLAATRLLQVTSFLDFSQPRNPGTVVPTTAGTPYSVEPWGLLGLLAPSPQRFDLIDFVPLDEGALGQTIDRFLEHVEEIGADLTWLRGPADVIVELLALAFVLKAVSKAMEHFHDHGDQATVDVATSLEGISGLPGGSSPEEP